MKRILIVMAVVAALAVSLFAGVTRETKSEVTFKGVGTLTSDSIDKLTPELSYTDSQNAFKGKGLVGTVAKAMFPAGHFGQIVNLTDLTQTTLDFKKKQYQVEPIKPLEMNKAAEKPVPGKEEPSEIKIVKSEFKVEETGESKDINGFPCKRYLVSWIVDWENTRTKQTGENKLLTDVWATPMTDTLREAQEEQMKFSQGYLKAMGINADTLEQDITGASWMRMLTALKPTEPQPKADTAGLAAEMKKIKGYPIIIDGKYFVTTQGGPQAEQPQEESGGGLLGKLGKGIFGKKKTEDTTNEPALAFYTEVKSVAVASLGAEDFQPPADFKKK
jgi:hypothetical protein